MITHSKNDHQTWLAIVDGDVKALKTLHDKYYPQLWHWAKQLTSDEAVAKELVSDCYIKLWENKRHIFIDKSVKSYLFSMVRNQVLSHLRKSKQIKIINYDELPEVPLFEEDDNNEFYVALHKALKKIPIQRRQILELAVFDSLSYAQIAEKLNISTNTVKTQISRSYKFLKEELSHKHLILFNLLRQK